MSLRSEVGCYELCFRPDGSHFSVQAENGHGVGFRVYPKP